MNSRVKTEFKHFLMKTYVIYNPLKLMKYSTKQDRHSLMSQQQMQ